MVTIREATEADKDEWNEVASQSKDGTYAHTWEWADVIEQGLGIGSVKLVAEDDGHIVGIYSGFLKEGKHNVLFSPIDITWDYGGPCCLRSAPGSTLSELLTAMEKQAKGKKAVSLRISPFFNSDYFSMLEDSEYRRSERLTSIIDLALAEDELWSNVKKNARRYINKPKEAGIKIIEDNSINGIRNCHNILDKFSSESDMRCPPLVFFEKLHEYFSPLGFLKIHLVYDDDKIIGTGLSFRYNGVSTFRYAAIMDEYKETYAHYLLHWERILEAKQDRLKMVDLGGMPNDEDNGVYFFKSRFGGKIVNVDWFVKDIKYKTLRKIRRDMKGRK